MFVVQKKDGEKFDKVFNQFRKNTRDLRLLQKTRDIMYRQRNPNQRRKKQIAKAREHYRKEALRQSYYA